jgi:hypothetical protein
VDGLSVYVEAAGQATLRRTLRAVLDHLDTLTQIAAASAAIGQSTNDLAHDRHTAAAQAAQAALEYLLSCPERRAGTTALNRGLDGPPDKEGK